jgi:hypothetical protein
MLMLFFFSFLLKPEVTTMEAYFQDHVGNFVVNFTRRQQAILLTAVEGETWTFLHVMKKVNHRDLDRVQFEIDSHVLIESIRISHSGYLEYSLVIADITQIMLPCVNTEVEFVRRQTNMIMIFVFTVSLLNLNNYDYDFYLKFHFYLLLPLLMDQGSMHSKTDAIIQSMSCRIFDFD